MDVKHLRTHLVLHLLELAVIIAAIALSTVMVLNTMRDENQGADSLLEPPGFNGHLYSIADVERDLEDLGCNIITFTEFYPESTIFYMSNYTDFRRIAYTTQYVLMKTEQTSDEARETVHLFATFDGTLFQHSIRFQHSNGEEPPEPTFEDLEIAGIRWTPNSAFAIVVENTGTKNVTVHHIEVNYVAIASGNVSPATPFPFKATDAAKTITVTYTYTNGSSYDISVVTSSGYEFTDHFVGGQDEPYTHGQAGVWLDHDAVSWTQGNITIYLRNKGTSDAEIDAVYVGTSSENLEPQTAVTYTPSTTVKKDGGTITITIDYAWASDTRYYFTIAPKLGQPHKFDEKAP